MKQFIATLPGNLLGCFKGRMLFGHVVAILLTVALVRSDFDWSYFLATRNPTLLAWMFHAARIGWMLPIDLPLAVILAGSVMNKLAVEMAGWALGQAVLLGLLISSVYKAFTGRAHPLHTTGEDISQVFHFGFLRGGAFWGWPSSHTTIAFAMAVTVCRLFPRQKWLGVLALIYALYIGIGVSMTIHWFSDFVAGAIIGTIIGLVVGKSFKSGHTLSLPASS